MPDFQLLLIEINSKKLSLELGSSAHIRINTLLEIEQ